jgi:hypothetical protein
MARGLDGPDGVGAAWALSPVSGWRVNADPGPARSGWHSDTHRSPTLRLGPVDQFRSIIDNGKPRAAAAAARTRTTGAWRLDRRTDSAADTVGRGLRPEEGAGSPQQLAIGVAAPDDRPLAEQLVCRNGCKRTHAWGDRPLGQDSASDDVGAASLRASTEWLSPELTCQTSANSWSLIGAPPYSSAAAARTCRSLSEP